MGFNFVSGYLSKYEKAYHLEQIYGEADDNKITVRIPHPRVLQLIARSLLLFLAIVAFPWIGSMIGSSSAASSNIISPLPRRTSVHNPDFLPMLFHDLANASLIKPGHHTVLIGNLKEDCIQLLKEINLDLLSGPVDDDSVDFIYTTGFDAAGFIDRALKIGGVVVVQLSRNPSHNFGVPLNFQIVYLRQFDTTVVAMKKTCQAAINHSALQPLTLHGRRLLVADEFTKKAALVGLEDALLAPPRVASRKSHKLLPRTRYLPDLLDDPLDEYPRRVFIDVGPPGSGSASEWFEQNYPTRNQAFEKYKVEAVAMEAAIGMSEWLRRNVMEEDYVVMKAEAEVAEELLMNDTIYLVDELFLECRHQSKKAKNKNESWRAYWECLSLYGKLRDQGIAVHQWWG